MLRIAFDTLSLVNFALGSAINSITRSLCLWFSFDNATVTLGIFTDDEIFHAIASKNDFINKADTFAQCDSIEWMVEIVHVDEWELEGVCGLQSQRPTGKRAEERNDDCHLSNTHNSFGDNTYQEVILEMWLVLRTKRIMTSLLHLFSPLFAFLEPIIHSCKSAHLQ
ncbi:hypothetical protein KCV07_g536, partial [Aureobasidium melanogenum]